MGSLLELVAEDAVSCEPVSAPNFPANREFNREFRRIRPSTAIFVSDQPARSIGCSQIPYAMKQGILKCISGNFYRGRGKMRNAGMSLDGPFVRQETRSPLACNRTEHEDDGAIGQEPSRRASP
jgi:hypothetical protein